MTNVRRRTTVIGLGNPLMGDDGLGVIAAQRLQEEWILPPEVEVVDGGTWGMNLLPVIDEAEELLLIDAIDQDMPPGTQIVLERDEIPRAFALKVSPHQIDLSEVIALAQLRGTLPERMTAVGLQPERVEFGVPLSPVIERHIDHLVSMAAYQLELWGHRCESRYRSSHA
jgi:hydrogenase maturation protease